MPADKLCALATLLAAACLCASAGIAVRAEGPPPGSRVCAFHDLENVTVIEEQGEAQKIAAAALVETYSTVVEARKACSQGHFADGISLYLSIPSGPASQKSVTMGQPVGE